MVQIKNYTLPLDGNSRWMHNFLLFRETLEEMISVGRAITIEELVTVEEVKIHIVEEPSRMTKTLVEN